VPLYSNWLVAVPSVLSFTLMVAAGDAAGATSKATITTSPANDRVMKWKDFEYIDTSS